MPDRAFPRLAVAAWAVAAAVLVGLAVSVVHYLNQPVTVGGVRRDSMGMSAAFYRGEPEGVSLHPILGLRMLTAWQLDAAAVALIVLAAAWYLTGVALVPIRQAGERWPLRRTVLFLGGLVVVFVATNGSIAVYDQSLFSVHMIGHLALVMLAPALLVGGRPLSLALAASSPERARRLGSVFTSRPIALLTAPPVALACYAAVIVGSHLTGAMNTIMRVTWAGQVEHLLYLVVGIQFFILVIGDEPIRWHLSSPARWLLLALAMAVDTFTGVVLLQGTQPIAMRPAPGLTVSPLSDTRTGGAIMWFGGDAIMAAVMVALVVAWLRRADDGREQRGWVEQARRATFTEHTGFAVAEPMSDLPDQGAEPLDDDEHARQAYNAWLARLDRPS